MTKKATVDLRDGVYTLSPLTLAQLELHEDALAKVMQEPHARNFVLLAPAIADSLRTHHPDMTPERVKEIVDIANFPAVLNAMFAVSGLERQTGEVPPQPVN